MNQHTKVLIIEDHELIVWALTSVTRKRFKDIEIILYSAANFDEGVDILKNNLIDLILLDIDVPGGHSPSMITTLRKIQPDVPILVHSALPEEEYAVKYLTAGASGFLSKKAPMSIVPEAIALVLDGKKYISHLSHDLITEKYLKMASQAMKTPNGLYLTEREKEIIILLLKGKWTKEIANIVGLKLTTISTYKARIFEKFEVANQVELFLKVQKEMPELLSEL